MTFHPPLMFSIGTKIALSILVAALLAMLLIWSPLIQLAAFGDTAQADVLDAESTLYGTDQDQIIHERTVTYTFTPRDGDALRVQEPVGEMLFARLSPGDVVSVRYLPRDPSRVMIEGNFLKVVQTSIGRVFLTLVILAGVLASFSYRDLFRDEESPGETPESPTLSAAS